MAPPTIAVSSSVASSEIRSGRRGRVRDIVTHVHGRTIDDATDVISALASTKAGDKVSVQVIRNHKSLTLTATMQDASWSSLFGPDVPTWFRSLMFPDGPRDSST